MGYSEAECTKIYQAGILHDIGKIATPDAVLLNPKALNALEYKLIQEHVSVGYKLINHVPMFADLAEMIHAHHEHYDGTGYPRGLKGDEILPLSRIMIVADSFDAMTTSRIYKARKSVKEALEELKALSGIQYDPAVVEHAIEALKEVVVADGINQLPKSELEEERFAYFYKDILTGVYNQNYLEIVLVKNAYAKQYAYMCTIFLKHFSKFNKTQSWNEGDVLLKKIALALKKHFHNGLVFRIFGDDFVVIGQTQQDVEKLKRLLDEAVDNSGVEYKLKSIDLREVDIDNIKQLEID
jgi:diguanylate cyclase (GGDEF)-like protein